MSWHIKNKKYSQPLEKFTLQLYLSILYNFSQPHMDGYEPLQVSKKFVRRLHIIYYHIELIYSLEQSKILITYYS